MNAFSPSPLTRLEFAQPLTLRLLKDHTAPPLAQVNVTASDFTDVLSEAWRDGCLRAGHAEAPLSDVPMRLLPILAEEQAEPVAERCVGFRIDLTLPDGKRSDCVFSFRCLRHVADRVSFPLLDSSVLQSGESFLYDVVVDSRTEPVTNPAPEKEISAQVTFRSRPLAFVRQPLRPLLERATPVRLVEDDVPPVFFTEQALARAEACARRGAVAGVETGGALFGSLASCPESGEFFTIVHDVVEVQDAEETKFSLNYSSRSWQRLQRIQQARQAAYPGRADRLVGQAHGHPFRPNGGKTCEECPKRPVCTLSSAFASEDDQLWHRAVFARQPWALCHIFGLTARGDADHQLFGLRDGRLQARGFHLLPDNANPLEMPHEEKETQTR